MLIGQLSLVGLDSKVTFAPTGAFEEDREEIELKKKAAPEPDLPAPSARKQAKSKMGVQVAPLKAPELQRATTSSQPSRPSLGFVGLFHSSLSYHISSARSINFSPPRRVLG